MKDLFQNFILFFPNKKLFFFILINKYLINNKFLSIMYLNFFEK